jgi:hypothetical protein
MGHGLEPQQRESISCNKYAKYERVYISNFIIKFCLQSLSSRAKSKAFNNIYVFPSKALAKPLGYESSTLKDFLSTIFLHNQRESIHTVSVPYRPVDKRRDV